MPQLGQKADKICNSAIERFTAEAAPDDDKQNEALYDRKIEDLEKVIARLSNTPVSHQALV